MSAGTAPDLARTDEARRSNRAALLRRLHVDGPCTRAVLATELALNRSTIKALVDGLAEWGLVEERPPMRRSGVGRPSLLVLPQARAAVVLAVDVRVEQVSVAVVGLGGEKLSRDSWRLRGAAAQPRELITRVVESSRMLTEDLGVPVVSAGVSVPGVVRRADGLVREAPHLRWADVPLGARLAELLGVPVLVGNDGELGALAEHTRGVARGASDIVFIAGAAGVGGGVISGGSAMRGGGGYVGELGHMVVRPDGRACHCGCRGCWETEIGEAALRRALGLPTDGSRGEVIAELRALAAEPARAVARLRGYCDWLALGLVNVVNVLAPELVVLGGLLAALPDSARQAVAAYLQAHSLVSRAVGGTRVVGSALGRDAQLVGAAELAFEPVLGAV